MSLRLLLLLAVAVLSACATPDVGSDYKLRTNSNEGVVAGSVTYNGRFSGYGVLYHQLPSGVSGRFETGQAMLIIPYIPKGDFDDDELKGTVFASALPAGDYEIFAWHVGSGPVHVRSTAPFSIRFRVEPGKAVYLGNFHFTQTDSMGLTVTGAKLTYRDAAQRDLPMIKKKFPMFVDESIAYAAPPGINQDNLGEQFRTQIDLPVFIPVPRK